MEKLYKEVALKTGEKMTEPERKLVNILRLMGYYDPHIKNNWWTISDVPELTEDFIRENKDNVKWAVITKKQTLTEDFIEEFADKVDWSVLPTEQNKPLSAKFIKKHLFELNLPHLVRYNKLTGSQIEQIATKITHNQEPFCSAFGRNATESLANFWSCVSLFQPLTDKFVDKHQADIDYSSLSSNHHLTTNQISRFQDKLDWTALSLTNVLSDDLLDQFHDQVNWLGVLTHQKVSENIIEKYCITPNIYWGVISKYQTLSKAFISRYRRQVNWDMIVLYQELTEDDLYHFANYINFNVVKASQRISEDFIDYMKMQ